jgi:hypothetical protein
MAGLWGPDVYTIHIVDLMVVQRDCYPLKLLLAGVVDAEHAVDVAQDQVGGVGLALTCDDERAQAIIQLIRLHYNRHEVRIFHSRTGSAGSWRKV